MEIDRDILELLLDDIYNYTFNSSKIDNWFDDYYAKHKKDPDKSIFLHGIAALTDDELTELIENIYGG